MTTKVNLVNSVCMNHCAFFFCLFLLALGLEPWRFITQCLNILDNTARILTKRSGFNRQEMSTYYLPVVISDSDYPIQSSTSTLTVRVCSCDSTGNLRSCSVDALLLSARLSTAALVAILLCIVILLSMH